MTSEKHKTAIPEQPGIVDADAAAQGWGVALQSVGCGSCGTAHLVPATAANGACPACHQQQLAAQPVRLRPEPPEALLSFALSRERIADRLQEWTRGVWIRPAELAAQTLLSRLKHTYLPMWLVDGAVAGAWQAEAGFNYEVVSSQEQYQSGRWQTRKVTETRIRWEQRAGTLQRSYDNRVAPALEDHEALLQQLGSFNYEAQVAYRAEALADAAVRIPDRPPADVWPLAMTQFDRAAAHEVQQACGAQHIREFAIDAEYTDLHWTQLLLPVYSTYYRDDDGRMIPVLLNGQTGQVSGLRRASQKKAWLWGGVLAAAALGLFSVGAVVALVGAVAPPLVVLGGLVALVGVVVGLAASVPPIWAWRFNARSRA